MSTGGKVVDGLFRVVLLGSAMYIGAKYAPYVLKVADEVKEKIIPAQVRSNYFPPPDLKFNYPPQDMMYSDSRLYNAILINQYVMENTRANSNTTPISRP